MANSRWAILFTLISGVAAMAVGDLFIVPFTGFGVAFMICDSIEKLSKED